MCDSLSNMSCYLTPKVKTVLPLQVIVDIEEIKGIRALSSSSKLSVLDHDYLRDTPVERPDQVNDYAE